MSEQRVLFYGLLMIGTFVWNWGGETDSPFFILMALIADGVAIGQLPRERWSQRTFVPVVVSILFIGACFAVLGYLFRREHPPLTFAIAALIGVLLSRLAIAHTLWSSSSQPTPVAKKLADESSKHSR